MQKNFSYILVKKLFFYQLFRQGYSIRRFIFVGFFCFRKGWLTKQGTSEISNLIVNVFNPLLMISTALSGSGSIPQNLMAQNLILMALFYGLMILLGPVVAKLLRVQGNDRKLVTIMRVFANTAFMGIPLSMIITGCALAQIDLKRVFTDVHLYVFSLFQLLLSLFTIPFVTMFV